MLSNLFKKILPKKEFMLRVRRSDENQGALLLGDPGTGKTQFIHQSVQQARAPERREPGVCYDPVGEFSQIHFREKIDYILNPLDERFPNWQLHWEVEKPADADLVAESFFPTQHIREEQFFNRAAKAILRFLLERKTSNEELIRILSDETLIDEMIEGTELIHKIPATAGPQRGAVMGTLVDLADALRMLPAFDKTKRDLSLSHWAKTKKHGWLFLTSTLDTRTALRPIQAAMLNILMMRLMSVPAQTGEVTPFWMIADELHSLNTLSALPVFVYESRKFGAKYIFGTQSKHQIVKNYGEEAKAILASPKLKVFLRCNEPETARWISDSIGEQEREMPVISSSIDARQTGKGSTSFSTRIEKLTVVSREQIMHLPDLNGYWCYEGRAIPFKLPYIDWQKHYPAFIEQTKPSASETARSKKVKDTGQNKKGEPKPNTKVGFDPNF